MLIVPFVVNVSASVFTGFQFNHQDFNRRLVSLPPPPAVRHVLGGGQPDDEEAEDAEEPGRLL